MPSIAKTNNVKSPAVIIVEQVCKFSERYDWFKPKKRIIATRKVASRLRELGFDVVEMQSFKIVPLAIPKINLKNYSWLVFTSGTGVNIFLIILLKTKLI